MYIIWHLKAATYMQLAIDVEIPEVTLYLMVPSGKMVK